MGIKCYNCQLLGHISWDCPQPRQPFKRNADGHTAKFCTTKKALEVSLIGSNQGYITSKYIYMKTVYLNENQDAVDLVDTGSTYYIITREVAEKHNLEIKPKLVNMYVYGNTTCRKL